MSDKTLISWSDATWNPVTGCSKVSPGCAHCYAETLSLRFGTSSLPWNPANAAANVVLHPRRLDQPMKWTKPRRIFVNSMSDLFHEAIPDEYIDKVFAVIGMSHQHTFQILTKRIERAAAYLGMRSGGSYHIADVARSMGLIGAPPLDAFFRTPFQHVLVGPTIENQHFADVRLPYVQQLHALGWRTMVSYEPALGPVNFATTKGFWRECPVCHGSMSVPVLGGGSTCPTCYMPNGWQGQIPTVSWLICGGESGAKRRPFDHSWARMALSQARNAGIPFFMKQDGAFRSEVYDTLPLALRIREYPDA